MTATFEDTVHQRLHELKLAQEALDPNISIHLREIHNALKEHPEVVSLLSDEEIRTWITVRRQLSNIAVMPTLKTTAKKAAASKAAKVSVDDI